MKFLLILLLFLVLLGCYLVGKLIDMVKVNYFVKGEIIECEVLVVFGKFIIVINNFEGECMFVYFYVNIDVKVFIYILVVGLFIGGVISIV